MKKTNRTFKRFAAITSASLLAACMVAPMAVSAASVTTGNGNTIIVEATDGANHTYKAYQIFSGNYSGNVLNDIQWGDGVNSTALLGALKADDVLKDFFADCESADDVAGVLSDTTNFADDGDNMQLFADIVSQYLNASATSGEATDNGVTKLPDGYYILMDSAAPTNPGTNDNSGAKSRYIIKVTADTTYEIQAKHAAPKVDKQVEDIDNEASSFGETADHAINKTFQFKLIATIPGNSEIAQYDTYKLVFNDKMSDGVTFESIESIVVDGVEIKDIAGAWSDNTADSESKDGLEWTLTVNDVKKHALEANWGVKDITVEVIYNAHLNENAILSNTDVDAVYSAINNNNVYLQYSNNPNSVGSGSGDELGRTKDDTVGVFTYMVKNTKRIETEDGNVLPGATFKLYSDEACTTEIALGSLTKDSKTVYVPYNGNADDATVTAVEAMESDTNGTFDIIGLDAGTYYVKEIDTPDGYNLIEKPWKIQITASHEEKEDGTGAEMDLGSSVMSYNYVNKKGTALPGTGGIGTTIFYLGGGAMAAIGGVYLISKRRMKKSEE